MTRGLADTTVFIARETGRALDKERLPDEIAVSVITVGELHAGVLAATDIATRDRRLATLLWARQLDPVPLDESVAEAWARLRVELGSVGSRMPVNDSWIAATAIALDVPLVTQDADHRAVYRLEVIRV